MTTNQELKELEAQTALALAALGVSFERTLCLISDSPEVSTTLRIEAGKMYQHLASLPESDSAQKMFSTFVRALFDPSIIGQN